MTATLENYSLISKPAGMEDLHSYQDTRYTPYDRGKDDDANSNMKGVTTGGQHFQEEHQASSTAPLPSPPLAPLLSRMVGPASGESQYNTSTEANSHSPHDTLAQEETTVTDNIFLINQTKVFFTVVKEQERC